MRLLLSLVKRFSAATLYWTGVLPLLWRMRFRKRALVLMYHRVLDDVQESQTFSHPGTIVKTSTFRRHISFLSRCGKILTLDEFLERLGGDEGFCAGESLVTFDDGWIDNYSKALPVMKEFQAPAVVFLATGLVGSSRLPWRERLGRVLYETHRLRQRPQQPMASALLADLEGLSDNSAQVEIRNRVSRLGAAEASSWEALVDALEEKLPPKDRWDPSADAFVSWEQVVEMQCSGFALGSHGVTHRVLTRIAEDDLAEELSESLSDIRKRTGYTSQAFSYPNGDFDQSVRGAVAKTYAAAFSTKPGSVGQGTDTHAITRVNVHEGACKSLPMFMAHTLGIW